MQMDKQELHDLFVGPLGLVPQATENNISRTYFHERVEWHPFLSTRVFRVLFEPDGELSRIQLCASSDNNNSVLIQGPFQKQMLMELAAAEIAIIEARATPAPAKMPSVLEQ